MARVTVVYASRHGATRGIATRIGEVLRERGLETTVVEARDAPNPATAGAIVLGSAAYMGKWLDEANDFVRNHGDALRSRPTWLFSSGPVGTETVDKQGHDVLEPPKFLTDLADALSARGTKVFFGRWDPSDPPVSMAERLFRKLPVPKEVLPIGDFRDWQAIDAWAGSIADALVAEKLPQPVG